MSISIRVPAMVVALCLLICSTAARGAVIFLNNGLDNGARWDAAPRMLSGRERSLDGGLRYSLQGGSFQSYRDLFTWQGSPPAVADFTQAIHDAFHAWTVVDPASGLGTQLSFVSDLSTPVVGPGSNGAVNTAGAEIDLLAERDGVLWNTGDGGLRAETYFNATALTTVKLTSGVTNYPSSAISGADIKMNSNPQAQWTLDWFRLILTHEIGHAIGLGDVDVHGPSGLFIDDNYDGTTSATALATLTNSWASLVNIMDPSASPLALYTVANGNPGVDTAGVNILMETAIPPSLLGNLMPLQNDDFGGRQFLYPIPEPSSVVLAALGLAAMALYARRKQSAS